jgi:prepilin-type processing-associated H-X9-DG protein
MLPIPVSYVFGIAKDAARGADSQAAMKQFGLIFEEYANQSEKEKWPVLTPMDEVWVPKLEPLHGAFSTNTQIMVSIYHPDKTRLQRALLEAWNQPVPDFANAARIFGESFAYLGFMVQSESEFETLWLARTQHAILPDGTLPSTFNPGTVLPLREGVERFLTTDINGPNGSPSAQAPIPVLIEIADWKYKESDDDFKGANVLYMDGHVAFVPLGTFPVLPSILDVLSGS